MFKVRYAYGVLLLIVLFVGFLLVRAALIPTIPPVAAADQPTYPVSSNDAALHLSQALQIKTVSLPRVRNNAAFIEFQQFLKTTYPAVFIGLQVLPSPNHSILLRWEGSDRQLLPMLWIAHYDVVPADSTGKDWHFPPFSGRIASDIIWGRGALDDKSQVIAQFEALNVLLQQGYRPQRTQYFYFGDDEEVGGKSAQALAQFLAQQQIKFDAIFDEGGAVFKGIFPKVSKKIAVIGIAEKGIMDVGYLMDAKYGGHSAIPTKKTAILSMSRDLLNLNKHPMKKYLTPIAEQMMVNIAPYIPYRERIMFANTWLFRSQVINYFSRSPLIKAMLRSTEVATIVSAGIKSNVIPTEARAIINVRLLPSNQPSDAIKHIKEVVNRPNRTITQLMVSQNQQVSSTDSKAYLQLKAAIKERNGDEVGMTPWLSIVATDSRHFAKLTNNIYRYRQYVLSNKNIKEIHGINESISRKRLLSMIIYNQIALQLFSQS